MGVSDWIWSATTRIVGDTIALWNPRAAADYRIARAIYRRKYVAAGTTGPYQLHRPSNISGDSEVLAASAKVSAKIRDMERNNPLVSGLLWKATTLIVGDEVGLKAQITGPDGPLLALNQAIEDRFYEWAESAEASGMSLTEAIQLVENHLFLDGEILVRHLDRGASTANPYRIQLMERDHLVTSEGEYGITRDDMSRAISYAVYAKHPAGLTPSGDVIKLPAAEVSFLADVVRCSQRRGISPLASAVFKIYGIDDLEDAELVASRAACQFGLVIKSALGLEWSPYTGTDGTVTPPTDDNGRKRQFMGAGGELHLDPGEDVYQVKNERPNSNFESFIRGRQRAAASAAGMSYESAVGDYSQVNYSSGRLGRLVEWAGIRRRQAKLRRLLNEIYRRWLTIEVSQVGIPGFSPTLLKTERIRFSACSWQLAGNDGIDPVKEIDAFERELALGVNSRTRFCAERGRDFREVSKEAAEEKAVLVDLGIYQEDPTVATTSFVSPETPTGTIDDDAPKPEPEEGTE